MDKYLNMQIDGKNFKKFCFLKNHFQGGKKEKTPFFVQKNKVLFGRICTYKTPLYF